MTQINDRDKSNLRIAEKALGKRRIKRAIKCLKELSLKFESHDDFLSLEQIESNYDAMRHFTFEGAVDPERDAIFEKMLERLYAIFDKLNFISPAEKHGKDITSNLPSVKTIFDNGVVGNSESISDFFYTVWTKKHFSPEEIEIVKAKAQNDKYLSSLTVSALLLSQLDYYNPAKTDLLVDIYLNAEDYASAHALTALLLIHSAFPTRMNDSLSFKNIMASVADVRPNFAAEVEAVFKNTIRASDTDRISKKLTDEIMPGIMSLGPEIRDKMKNINPEELSAIEDNPEWMEMLDKSGLTDRLREISEIQEQGGDIMMGTFSKMKHFPFFSNLSNWFKPFNPDNEELQKSGVPKTVLETIADNPVLCDSDKHSMVFMLAMMPLAHSDLVMEQMKQQGIHAREIDDASLRCGRIDTIAEESALYIQNLYRFFNLYRNKEDYFNPFGRLTNIFDNVAVAKYLTEKSTKVAIAEAYMAAMRYDDAISVYSHIPETDKDAVDYQKCGFCYRRLRKYAEAAEMFTRADDLRPSNKWTLRQLGYCFEMTGDNESAIRCYDSLCEMFPESPAYAMLRGMCLKKLNRNDDALQTFYKVLFYNEKSVNARLELSRLLADAGNLEKAKRYADEAVALESTFETLVQRATLEIKIGETLSAVDDFAKACEANEAGYDKMVDVVNEVMSDNPMLANFIIDEVADRISK